MPLRRDEQRCQPNSHYRAHDNSVLLMIAQTMMSCMCLNMILMHEFVGSTLWHDCAVFYLNMKNNLQHVQKVVFWTFLSPALPSCVVWISINCYVLFWHKNCCVLFFLHEVLNIVLCSSATDTVSGLSQGEENSYQKLHATKSWASKDSPNRPGKFLLLPWVISSVSPFVYLSTLFICFLLLSTLHICKLGGWVMVVMVVIRSNCVL